MITLPITQYAFLISVSFALIVLLLYFIVLNLINSKRFGRSEEQLHKLKLATEKKQDEILERARYDYEAIIRHATEKAEEIVRDANKINKESSGALDRDFDKVLTEQRLKLAETADSMEKKYEGQIEEINQENIKMLRNIYKDLIDYSASTFGVFKEEMEKQTMDSKNLADAKIKDEYEKLEVELEQKKKEALERIDHNVYKVLTYISKEAIGKGIKYDDQQALIIDALDKAKKELL